MIDPTKTESLRSNNRKAAEAIAKRLLKMGRPIEEKANHLAPQDSGRLQRLLLVQNVEIPGRLRASLAQVLTLRTTKRQMCLNTYTSPQL